MPQNAFPTGDDLALYIESLGLIEPADLPQALNRMLPDVKMAAAVSDFENQTGFSPFLGVTQTRNFDPPGPNTSGTFRGGRRVLDVRGGLLSVTTLKTGVDRLSTPTTLTENTDFYLIPYESLLEGRPFEAVQFVMPQWGLPRSLEIDGVWGYSLTVPEDVWQGLVQYGAYLCYQELSLQTSRGIYSYRDLNSEIRYAGGKMAPLDLEQAAWLRNYRGLIRRYRRVVM